MYGKTFVCADTHGAKIEFDSEPEDLLIHLGDYEMGEVLTNAKKIIVVGNHDSLPLDQFDFACDGFLKDHIWFTHEPAERLPKGAYWNVCGHIHDGKLNDYGYEKKPWHILLPPNEILNLDKVLWENKHS
jgi:predicted phosphodiesterase